MNYKDMSVSKKMLVSVILLLVVFTVVIVSYALISFNDLTNEMSTKDANISLELLEGEVNSLKEQSKNITVLLAKNPELTKAVANRSKEEIISSVNKITAGLSIEFITLMDTEGNVLARIHQPEKSGDNLAYQDNIKGAIQGKTLSLIEEGTAIKLSARTGAPLYDETGTFVGVVSTGYRFDKEQTVDNLKSITGNEFTIFLGDERVSSTIMVDGKRAIGTKLDPVIANIILKEGKEYNGEADILGVPYITSYKPLRGGEKNDIIGVLFSGVPLSQVKAANKSMITMIVVLTAAFLRVLIWILSVIIKKIIGIPVNTLTGMAKEVALGNVDLKIDYESKDEIGELAASFRDLLATQKEKAIAAESISRGDTDVIISLRSDRDILSHSILKVAETNKELVKEFEYLIKAALDGKLKTRGNSDRFSGGYKELITGVNSLLEAVVAPVQEG
jgi:methyl-accepting chemotaxis protein